VKDWQPTPILGEIPAGGRLFCWWDRGMEILYRCGVVCPGKRQEQVLRTHMLGCRVGVGSVSPVGELNHICLLPVSGTQDMAPHWLAERR
jgi:hypothetical protein